jgi:hypothetical protein
MCKRLFLETANVIVHEWSLAIRMINTGSHVEFPINIKYLRGHHGHDRIVVGLTTTYAICAYHH